MVVRVSVRESGEGDPVGRGGQVDRDGVGGRCEDLLVKVEL